MVRLSETVKDLTSNYYFNLSSGKTVKGLTRVRINGSVVNVIIGRVAVDGAFNFDNEFGLVRLG